MATTKIIKSDLIFPHVSSRTRTQTSVTLLSQADPLLIYHHVIHHHLNFFSTDLPLAETRWGWSTFSSQCHISSNQCDWLTSTTSTFFLWKIREHLELNAWQLGQEGSMLTIVLRWPTLHFDFMSALMGFKKSLLTRALSARIFSRGARLAPLKSSDANFPLFSFSLLTFCFRLKDLPQIEI